MNYLKRKWREHVETHGIAKTVILGLFYLTVVVYTGLFLSYLTAGRLIYLTAGRLIYGWGMQGDPVYWVAFILLLLVWLAVWWWMFFPSAKSVKNPNPYRIVFKTLLGTLLLMHFASEQIATQYLINDAPDKYCVYLNEFMDDNF